MPELNENDLQKLFRTAGRQAPVNDQTDRIMARVAVTRIERPLLVQPLISAKGWVAATLGLGAILIVLLLLPGSPIEQAGPISNMVTMLVDGLAHLKVPHGSWPLWLALVAGSMLLFSWIDAAWMRRLRSAHR